MKTLIIRIIKKYHAPLIGLGLLVALYTVERIYNYPYRKYGIYTVCTITDVRKTGKGSRSSFYYFFYKGKQYEGRNHTGNLTTKKDIGRRYFVRFLKEDPTHCAIIAEKPVPYCIKEVPPEGWEVKSIIPPKDFIYWSEAQTFTSTGKDSCMILIIENHSVSYFDYLPTFRSAFEETYLSVVDETHFTVNGFPAIILFIHQDSRYDGYRILFGDAHEKIQAT